MAQFALRLDDGKAFRIRADLALGWSGKAGELATCAWENGTVVFVDNTIQAGIPLKHLQGQIDHLRGSFDGRDLVVSRGARPVERQPVRRPRHRADHADRGPRRQGVAARTSRGR